MRTDSQLLLEQLRKAPDDLALLSAYADALAEEGNEDGAILTNELIRLGQMEPTTEVVLQKDKFRFWLGIRHIVANDLIHGDGYPVDMTGPWVSGVAMGEPDGDVVDTIDVLTGEEDFIVTSKPYQWLLTYHLRSMGGFKALKSDPDLGQRFLELRDKYNLMAGYCIYVTEGNVNA